MFRLQNLVGRKKIAKALKARSLEAVNQEEITEKLKVCGSALLYGSQMEATRIVKSITEGSEDLIAFVGCPELQDGHRQIAIMGPIGKSSPENVESLGFMPDLIVARCKTLKEAAGLLEWTVFGPRLLCIANLGKSDHRIWNLTEGFELIGFCGNEDASVCYR